MQGFFDNHPRLRHAFGRTGWYFLTFLVAVAVNFFLPRLGDANPVDTLITRAAENLDAKTAREQEEAYLKEFGLVEVDARRRPHRDSARSSIRSLREPESAW